MMTELPIWATKFIFGAKYRNQGLNKGLVGRGKFAGFFVLAVDFSQDAWTPLADLFDGFRQRFLQRIFGQCCVGIGAADLDEHFFDIGREPGFFNELNGHARMLPHATACLVASFF